MPDLVEQMYCSQQIHIPPTFPFILKQYCKAAIRTQPYDLLRWSAAYFRCMASGEPPPVKVRLEYPQTEFPSGLTPGYLRVLLKQFAGKQFVGAHELFRKWRGVSLDEKTLAEIFMLGGFGTEIDLLKFIAIAAAYLSEKLSRTMILICELLTEEPDGGSAMISCDIFINLYTFLASLNCGPVLEGENVPSSEDLSSDVDKDRKKQEANEILDTVLKDVCSQNSSEKSTEGEEEAEEEETEKKTPDEGDVERIQATESDPQLLKCKSDNRVMVNIETAIKNALWDALLEKLPAESTVQKEEEGTELEEEEAQKPLKEELWNAIMDNINQSKQGEGDIRKFLSTVVENIPENNSPAEQVPIEILKNAIWEAVTGKKPPPFMTGTVWETASKTGQEAANEVKNDIWNAVVERIPGEISESGSEETELSLKYHAPRTETDSMPSWVGYPVTPYRVEIKGIGPVIDDEQVQAVAEFMKYWAERQEGMVMPRNIRHFLCPPLDPPEEYDLDPEKELMKEEKIEEESSETFEEEVVDDAPRI